MTYTEAVYLFNNTKWGRLLLSVDSSWYMGIGEFLDKRVKSGVNVYPSAENLFRAFSLCSPKKCSVVIMGQDPYFTKDTANGLAFSIKNGNKINPSLRNIFKEIYSEFPDSTIFNRNTELNDWAAQGVLLLNTALSVEEGKAGSHIKNKLWVRFSNAVCKILNMTPKAILLWGEKAKSMSCIFENHNHLILQSGHPSGFSAKFFLGNGHFKETNKWLVENNRPAINWQNSPLMLSVGQHVTVIANMFLHGIIIESSAEECLIRYMEPTVETGYTGKYKNNEITTFVPHIGTR